MSRSYWSKYKFDAAYRAHVLDYQRDKYRQDPSQRQLASYKRHLLNNNIARPRLRTLMKHGLVDWYLDRFGKDGLKRCVAVGVLQPDGLRRDQGDASGGQGDRPDSCIGSDEGLAEEARGEPDENIAEIKQLRGPGPQRRVPS